MATHLARKIAIRGNEPEIRKILEEALSERGFDISGDPAQAGLVVSIETARPPQAVRRRASLDDLEDDALRAAEGAED